MVLARRLVLTTGIRYQQVVEQAKALGFSRLGVLHVEDLTLDSSGLRDWLALGYHGEMDWMVTHLDKRLDPLSLMDGTQSIICVGMNYYPGELDPKSEAKIARYAQGDDYHDVIKARLKSLLNWMKAQDPAIEGRPLTDSAPIMEKALAVKAGLGWAGKHSNLITRDQGSWLFLGELLLNVRFDDAPRPQPMANFCGSCRRCIEACPTSAIVEDGVVDATKCIAYWTIEYKGESFPKTIQDNLSGWLFGCDICQEVCPWNQKFQTVTTEPAFTPRPWNKRVRLADMQLLTPEQLRVRYRKSPIKRPKLSGLLRNARMLTLPDSR